LFTPSGMTYFNAPLHPDISEEDG